jgi:hypothetical protein
MNRTDITSMVTHLTKPFKVNVEGINEDDINVMAVDNLIKILADKKINGSNTESGFIIGKTSAVCFQDAPFSGIIQNVEYEKQRRLDEKDKKIRYCGIGLAFSKFYAFSQGGRPVIYEETKKAKEILPKDEYWRIVNFHIHPDDTNIIDWTHEREWRAPVEFKFDLELAHVVLYDKVCWDYFYDKCPKEILNEIHGITMLKSFLM